MENYDRMRTVEENRFDGYKKWEERKTLQNNERKEGWGDRKRKRR